MKKFIKNNWIKLAVTFAVLVGLLTTFWGYAEGLHFKIVDYWNGLFGGTTPQPKTTSAYPFRPTAEPKITKQDILDHQWAESTPDFLSIALTLTILIAIVFYFCFYKISDKSKKTDKRNNSRRKSASTSDERSTVDRKKKKKNKKKNKKRKRKESESATTKRIEVGELKVLKSEATESPQVEKTEKVEQQRSKTKKKNKKKKLKKKSESESESDSDSDSS